MNREPSEAGSFIECLVLWRCHYPGATILPAHRLVKMAVESCEDSSRGPRQSLFRRVLQTIFGGPAAEFACGEVASLSEVCFS